jgi:TolA-binding protein
MALQKSIPQPQGVDASYWMIEQLSVRKKAEKATFTLAGYHNQSVRNNNPDEGVLTRRTIHITGSDFTTFYTDVVVDKTKRTYEAAYEYIKTRPGSDFSNAEDIFEGT